MWRFSISFRCRFLKNMNFATNNKPTCIFSKYRKPNEDIDRRATQNKLAIMRI